VFVVYFFLEIDKSILNFKPKLVTAFSSSIYQLKGFDWLSLIELEKRSFKMNESEGFSILEIHNYCEHKLNPYHKGLCLEDGGEIWVVG
jgi:hypothetical protein